MDLVLKLLKDNLRYSEIEKCRVGNYSEKSCLEHEQKAEQLKKAISILENTENKIEAQKDKQH
jgi:hypothetical protein